MKKLILIFIFFFLSFSFASAWFMDTFTQPHIWVVKYNEVLEEIKANSLQSVSIFDNEDLYRRWANVVASIWILIIWILLVKIIVSMIYGSQNNLKKDIAILMLLLIISVLFTPFFSSIGSLMAWSERTYHDEATNEDFSRIYIPSNKAIVVGNSYIDPKNWNLIKMEEVEGLLPKRKTIFKWDQSAFSEDYLWIPAKVFQTQWESKETPTKRYSRAFYSVNVDTLFQGTQWPIPNLMKKLWVDKCTIQLKDYVYKKAWAPLTFLESIWHTEYKQFYDTYKDDLIDSIKKPFKVQWKEYPWSDLQIQIPAEKCNLWLYLISNEFYETYNWDTTGQDYNWISWNLLMKWYLIFDQTDSLKKLAKEWLSYIDQKRIVYINQAIRNLYFITQLTDKKLSSDENLKNIQLACWRIITDSVQSNADFKKCLKGDAFWDSTIYTKETTQKIWLMGKNKKINGWYVMPIPQSSDWSFPLYYEIELSIWQIATKSIAKIGWGIWAGLYKHLIKDSLLDPIRTIWSTWTYAINWITEGYDKILSWSWERNEKSVRKEIEYWSVQKGFVQNIDFWSLNWMSPQLASMQSYDLDWNWKSDYDWKFTKSDFYWYHYTKDILNWVDDVELATRNYNTLNTPLYQTTVIENSDNLEFKALNWKHYVIKNNEISNFQSDTEKFGNKDYLLVNFDSTNPKSIWDDLTIEWWQYFITEWTKWYKSELFNPVTQTPTRTKIKDSWEYEYFLQPDLNTFYYSDEKMIEKKNVKDTFSLIRTWYFTSDKDTWTYIVSPKNTILPNWKYFLWLENDNSKFTYCEGSAELKSFYKENWCKTISSIDNKTIPAYIRDQKVNWKIVYNIYNIYKNWKLYKENWHVYQYLWVNEKISRIPNFTKLFLPETNSSYSSSTNFYYYKNLVNWNNFSTPKINHYRYITSIIQKEKSLIWKKIWDNTVSVWSKTTIETCESDKCKWLYWISQPLKKERVNFNELDKKYPFENARILLNPKLNLPLTYTPNNQHYLPEYQKMKQMCLINKNNTSIYSNLFDSKDWETFQNCSLIWDHTRITDIRLQTYIKTENYFNLTEASKSFTHIYIPLTTNQYLKEFTSDRRYQNFAWEATKKNSDLISFQKIKWIKIMEWDVIVLKPWVVLWAYDFPFTIMVPTKLMPFIKYVKLNNLNEEVTPSRVYTTWVYAWLTSFISYLKNWSISKFVFWDAADINDRQKYTNFNLDKYDSRPDALKYIEGIVADRYFHSYYWEAYYNEAEASSIDSMTSWISQFVLSLINWLLKYRVTILETFYLIWPILTFCLIFTGTRKIFTFAVTFILSLIILPVVILFFVNFLT